MQIDYISRKVAAQGETRRGTMGTGIIDVYRVFGKGCTVTLTFSDIVTLTIVSGPRLCSVETVRSNAAIKCPFLCNPALFIDYCWFRY